MPTVPTTTITVDQSDVEPGVVLVTLEQGDQTMTVRLVHQQIPTIINTLAVAGVEAISRLAIAEVSAELARREQEANGTRNLSDPR